MYAEFSRSCGRIIVGLGLTNTERIAMNRRISLAAYTFIAAGVVAAFAYGFNSPASV